MDAPQGPNLQGASVGHQLYRTANNETGSDAEAAAAFSDPRRRKQDHKNPKP